VKVFPYNFSQNGLVAYKNGELLNVQTMSQHIGEDNVKRIVNWTLKYIAELDIPIKVCKLWMSSLLIRELGEPIQNLTVMYFPPKFVSINYYSVVHSLNFVVVCLTFRRLDEIVLVRSAMTMKSLIWSIKYEKRWWH
jgi:Eukaryotic phosphomannomutase